MLFYVTLIILALACSAITIKTLVGYADIKLRYKLVIGIVIVLGWFGVLIVNALKSTTFISPSVYSAISTVLYSLMGFVFILFIFIVMRDIIWYMLFYLSKLLNIDAWYIDPQNLSVLNKANFLIVVLSILVCSYATYEGNKTPQIVKETIESDKLSRDLRIIQISDIHITRSTPDSKILRIVNEANMQNPDVIVLTGDIIDDKIDTIGEKIKLLSGLSAPFGVYAIMGNHEFYNDVYAFKKEIENIGIKFLFNGGVHVANSNIYLSGLPDFSTMFERINLWRSVKSSEKGDYRVLLSHQPLIIDSLNKEMYDLVLSGHTHGGQIFPIHVLAKKSNFYLSGRHNVNGIELIVSQGSGTWGPNMRLFAPSDIVVIDLLKK